MKVPGVIENASDLLNLPLRSTGNSTVTLSNVAQVRRTFYDPTTYARVNGQPTISLDVTKRIGSNIIANNQAVRDIVDKAAKTWPPGVHVTYIFDQSKDIRDMLGSLSDSIILAIVLVMIIIVAALGLRAGLLVGVAIPTSFLMAFMVLNGLGMSLNMMIMFGMLLAVGILVDGAIIVVEYADRKMTEGHKPKQAFAEAALRMFWPVGQRDCDDDRRLPADASVARRGGQVHELLPDHADHHPVGVDGRGAGIPAGAGRHFRQTPAARSRT